MWRSNVHCECITWGGNPSPRLRGNRCCALWDLFEVVTRAFGWSRYGVHVIYVHRDDSRQWRRLWHMTAKRDGQRRRSGCLLGRRNSGGFYRNDTRRRRRSGLVSGSAWQWRRLYQSRHGGAISTDGSCAKLPGAPTLCEEMACSWPAARLWWHSEYFNQAADGSGLFD